MLLARNTICVSNYSHFFKKRDLNVNSLNLKQFYSLLFSSPISFSSTSQATILTCSFFIIVYYVYCLVCILLYASVIALYISFYFFSTQHYVFKMHLSAFLYILFIASNTMYLSRYTFITFCLSTLPMIEISNSLPPNNTAFFF